MVLERPSGSNRDDIKLFSDDNQNCSIDISCEEKGTSGQSVLRPETKN
jgi:hypothetical protein